MIHSRITTAVILFHRRRQGSLKNGLAAGVLPCGRFGANAAWPRLAILTHNALTALKRPALPEELLQARPNRLREIDKYEQFVVSYARKRS